jgi:hypothetical protein
LGTFNSGSWTGYTVIWRDDGDGGDDDNNNNNNNNNNGKVVPVLNELSTTP